MGKRLNSERDEMETIMEHLDRQDKTLSEILILLRGSISMGVDGIISKQKEAEVAINQLCQDVQHLQRWQKIVQDNRGKFTISWTDVAKTIFSIIGIVGTVIAIFLGIKQLFDKAQ